MANFIATVMAANEAEAVERVEKQLAKLPGFATTGQTAVRSQRHLLMDVEVDDRGGDVNHAWVVLTSYGISPSEELGSHWTEAEKAWAQ